MSASRTQSCPSGHLKKAVALGVQRVLEPRHVVVLLRIDALIRPVHGEVLDVELHRGASPLRVLFCSPRSQSVAHFFISEKTRKKTQFYGESRALIYSKLKYSISGTTFSYSTVLALTIYTRTTLHTVYTVIPYSIYRRKTHEPAEGFRTIATCILCLCPRRGSSRPFFQNTRTDFRLNQRYRTLTSADSRAAQAESVERLYQYYCRIAPALSSAPDYELYYRTPATNVEFWADTREALL